MPSWQGSRRPAGLPPLQALVLARCASRQWRRQGLEHQPALAVIPAMCFPLAAHARGGDSRRALPHVSWPCVSTALSAVV